MSEKKSPKTDVIDLSGLSIFDMDGIRRVSLQGEYTAESLGDKLVRQWIPYFECEHCGRSDYCKYTLPDKYLKGRLKDIKCGVIVDALKNYVQHTFHLLQSKSKDQLQCYLDGAFHIEQFLYSAEQTTGMLISKEFLKWAGEDIVPSVFGQTVHLREHLTKAARELQKIPEFSSRKAMLFVEGYTEKEFLDKLKESRLSWFSDLRVQVYAGKANKKPNRIEMLLEQCIADGYTVYIQGDGDGGSSDIFNALIKKRLVRPENTFVFCHDFESSFPSELFFSALRCLGKLEEVSSDSFVKALEGSNQSISTLIKNKFDLNINPLKIDIAKAAAEILNCHEINWFQNKGFMDTELGRFLMFIIKVNLAK